MKTIIVRSIKGQIYASQSKYQILDKTLYACNYIYNYMLERNQKIYKRRGEYLSAYDMHKLLTSIKKYETWLKEADSQALKQACKQVDIAYKNFFKHNANFPRFHSRHKGLSYTTTQNIKVNNNQVQLPLVGKIKVRGLRNMPVNSKICYATVSRKTNGKYYLSITYKYEVDIKKNFLTNNFIGLDYVSNGLYVNSMAEEAKMPRYFRESQAKIAKAQRNLSKKQGNKKGQKKSCGWNKAHKKLVKEYEHIANQRKDFLHKNSRYLANTYSGVAVENINMKTLANKNFGNGKSVFDNGFGEFRLLLSYKLEEQGKPFIKIDRWFPSSQLCCCCGFQNKELKNLQIRNWKCPKCGCEHDRDLNASINIRNEGLRMLLELA